MCVFARVCVHVYTVFDLVMVTNLSLCLSQITLWLHSSFKTDAANRDPTLDPKLDAEEWQSKFLMKSEKNPDNIGGFYILWASSCLFLWCRGPAGTTQADEGRLHLKDCIYDVNVALNILSSVKIPWGAELQP